MKSEAEHLRLNETKWDKWAHAFDGEGWRYKYLRQAQNGLLSLLDIHENIRVLDVGCGTGWALGEAATRVADKGLFYGVDLSEKMIEKATENFVGRGSLHFIKANVESIPLDGNFFDIVISTNSFHHYLHPDRALTEMQRLLKPEGRIYILDPTADHWIVTVADKIARFFEREHVKMYSTIEFRAMFETAGLQYIGSENVITREKVHIAQKLSDTTPTQT